MDADAFVSFHLFGRNGNDDDMRSSLDRMMHVARKLTKVIKKSTNKQQTADALFECLYSLNVIYKACGMMRLICGAGDVSTFDYIDGELDVFFDAFYADEQIRAAIKSLDGDDAMWAQEIVSEFSGAHTSRIKKALHASVPVKKSGVRVSVENYTALLCVNKTKKARAAIHDSFASITSVVASDYVALVTDDHARDANQREVNAVKVLVNNLIASTTNRCVSELNAIAGDSKLAIYDLQCIVAQSRRPDPAEPPHDANSAMSTIIRTAASLFGVTISQVTEDHSLPYHKWSDRVIAYQVHSEQQLHGIIYVDIAHVASKQVIAPLCVHISQAYRDIKGKYVPTVVAVIASTRSTLNSSQLIGLYSEFGAAMQMLLCIHCRDTTVPRGVYIENRELRILFMRMMVHAATREHKGICRSLNECIGLATRIECAIVLFCHIMRTSPAFAAQCHATTDHAQLMHDVFRGVWHNVMSPLLSLSAADLDLDCALALPSMLARDIDSDGRVYDDLLLDIFAFGIFTAVTNDSSGALACDLTQTVNAIVPSQVRVALNDFVTRYRINSYDVYVETMMSHEN